MANLDPKIYDLIVGSATGASSAAPTFFDPRNQIDGYGFSELQIDGGVICNNPGLYAYNMAKYFGGHKKIRLVSLGTGEKPFTKKDPEQMDKAAYMAMNGEFMLNADTYTANNWLNHTMPDPANNYVRVQTPTPLGMDKVDKASIDGLIVKGNDLWDNADN